MRALVLGGAGMLGHKVVQCFSAHVPDTWCTIRCSRSDPFVQNIPLFSASDRVLDQVDVMDWEKVAGTLRDLRPNVVINCVGVIKQRVEAKAAIPSITLNALLPHRLAEAVAAWGGRLVHISTDCVFSGRRGLYTEDDVSDAEDLYGRTKYLGEVAGGNVVTLRTSMIGRELTRHQSLLDWVLSQNGCRIHGYRRAYFSGVTTNELASVILRVVRQHPDLTGVYQVASETITKYDLLRLIVEAFHLDIEVEPDDQFFCDRSLIGAKFEAATGYRPPSWPDLVQALAADSTPYDKWTRWE